MDNLIKKDAFIVDVRTEAEFAEGHVNESTNIPLDQVASHLEKFKGKEQIIVFCRSGNRSGQAKMILEQNGFKNIINGGTWQEVKEAISK
jgi:phage shock protein E